MPKKQPTTAISSTMILLFCLLVQSCFFKKKGNRLITRPMKGTITRGYSTKEDLGNKIWLANDSKNRAENMMIVDLLRKDMGRISEICSVKVTKFCEVEQYSTVWQMTSTIESQLQSDKSLLDIFLPFFTVGQLSELQRLRQWRLSIKLEKQPRGVYCGTIGICLLNGDAIFNIGICIIQKPGNQAIYGAGGGITWGECL